MEIYDLKKTAIAPDGREVRLDLETDTGQIQCHVNVATLDVIVGMLIRLMADAARVRAPSTLEQTLEVEGTAVTASRDGAVVMTLVLPNSYAAHYALTPTQAEVLLVQLASTEPPHVQESNP